MSDLLFAFALDAHDYTNPVLRFDDASRMWVLSAYRGAWYILGQGYTPRQCRRDALAHLDRMR